MSALDPTTATDRLRAALSDRYRFERELGAGGMATVYLALDLKHDRKVAVKIPKPESWPTPTPPAVTPRRERPAVRRPRRAPTTRSRAVAGPAPGRTLIAPRNP